MIPRVIIAGATGYLGTRLLRRLPPERIAGVIARRPSLALPGVQWLIGEAGIEATRPQEAEGCVLFHLIGSGRGRRSRDLYDTNVRSTEKLVDFAAKTGVRRIVYMSGFGTGGETSSAYFQAKREAEEVVERSGLDHAILRCSYVLGGDDEFKPWLTASIAEGIVRLPGSGAYRIQPIYVDDLVSCFLALADVPGRLAATYDFVGEPVTFRAFIERLLARLGAHATVGEASIEDYVRAAARRVDPVFSLDELAILLSDIVGPWTETVAGVHPRAAEAVIDAIVAEFAAIAGRPAAGAGPS